MVSGYDCKYCNVIESCKTVFQRFFSHIMQSLLLVLLQGCFKKPGIQFKRKNMLLREDKEY